MVQRPIVRAILLSSLILSKNAIASSSWVAEEDNAFFSLSSSVLTKAQHDERIEKKLKKILYNLKKIDDLQNDTKNKDTIINNRLKLYEKELESLQNDLDSLNKKVIKQTINIYYEQGIYKDYSIGINANNSENIDIAWGEKTNFENGEIFLKKQLKNTDKKVVSVELGAAIEDYRKNIIRPYYKINLARIGLTSQKRKLIHTANFAYHFDSETNLSLELSETLEFKNGFSLSISNYTTYNRNYNQKYQIFSRDQLTVAKKIKSAIFPLLENSTLSFGVYSDYYGKARTSVGEGVICGIWIRL